MNQETTSAISPEAPRLIRMTAATTWRSSPTSGLPAGASAPGGRQFAQAVPQGHKVALADIAEGAPVRRYDVVIGYAAEDLPAGSWVNEHASIMPAPPGARRAADRDAQSAPAARSTATRSRAIATPTARSARATSSPSPPPCSAWPAWSSTRSAHQRRAAAALSERRRRRGARAHLRLRRRDRRARRRDPDPHAAQHQPQSEFRRRDDGGRASAARSCSPSACCPRARLRARRRRPGGVTTISSRLQDEAHVGFESMIDSIMQTAEQHLERLDARRRETCPASELVVGVQCGGSDAFSGVTANPAVGFASRPAGARRRAP